jgi:hypothetical protein
MRHTQQNSEQIQNFNSVFKEAFKFEGQVTGIDDEHIYLSGDMNAAQKLNASLKDLGTLKEKISPNAAHVPTEEEVTKRAEEKTKISALSQLSAADILRQVIPADYQFPIDSLNLQQLQYNQETHMSTMLFEYQRPADKIHRTADITLMQSALSSPKVSKLLLGIATDPVTAEEVEVEPTQLGKSILSAEAIQGKKQIAITFNHAALRSTLESHIEHAVTPPVLHIQQGNVIQVNRGYFLRFLKELCPQELLHLQGSAQAYAFNAPQASVDYAAQRPTLTASTDLYILLDNTRSLNGTRDEYVQGIQNFLRQIKENFGNANLNIISFAGSTRTLYTGTASSLNVDTLCNDIDCTGKTTHIYSALDSTLQTIKSAGKQNANVILFTDGKDKSQIEPENTCIQTAEELRSVGNNFEMHILGFGKSYKDCKEKLQHLAEGMGIKTGISESTQDLFTKFAHTLDGIGLPKKLVELIIELENSSKTQYLPVVVNNVESVKVPKGSTVSVQQTFLS